MAEKKMAPLELPTESLAPISAAEPGPAPQVRIAVVYHTRYGHTGRQAEAVKDGVQEVPRTECLLMTVDQAEGRWEDLLRSHAIVFGAPTYMGGPSARFKAFQDATSNAVMSQGYLWKDKIAAGFTNSGARSGDKLSTLMQLALFAAQHGMHWINLGLPPANNSTSGSDADLNRLGFWLGATAQSNVDQGPDVAPPKSDLATAQYLGARVALTTWQLVRGRQASGSP